MPAPIEDYALIGDCQTAALVSREGSIDWLCFPRFDSGACFAALLGNPEHGRWQIVPAGEIRSITRRYRGDTLILETDFETDDGLVTLVDCMPPRTCEPDLIRTVICKRGRVPLHMHLVIRFDYGSIVPWVRRIDGGILAIAGPDSLILQTDVPIRGENLTTVADFTLNAGEQVKFSLMWYPSHEAPPPRLDAARAVADTESFWKEWSGRCTYQGEWRDAVLRSLITLKALTYAPTGGMVAAPTTSLPEQIGSVRNWDYRYCWLRDATFTLYALMSGGYETEASAFREWLLRAVAGNPAQLNIMYGIAGERRLTEIELSWLPGYEDSAPVRIGNAAHEQFQLDVFGEIMDAAHLGRRVGLPHAKTSWKLQLALLKFVSTAWKEPDEGIWEVRGPRRHFTHSKVMAWVAVDRMIKAVEQFGYSGSVDTWRALRGEIHADICRQGFDTTQNSFVQSYGATELDASLLLIPLVGFLPVDDPRVTGTVAAIERELLQEGFVIRYPTHRQIDGLPPGEGRFLPCTFWLADTYALQGRYTEARELFERLLSLQNDVGLLSEEYDPASRRLLGNFPQAFTHVALVNTACNLVPRQQKSPAEHRSGDGGTHTDSGDSPGSQPRDR